MNLSIFSNDAVIFKAREAIKDEPRVTGCQLWAGRQDSDLVAQTAYLGLRGWSASCCDAASFI